MDKTILSFGDSLLHLSDLILIEKSGWLNDKIIGFVYEYFEVEQFKNAKDDIVFLNPSVVQLIKMLPKMEAAAILDSSNLLQKKLAFIPLNDNETLYPGGSHWSLIVCDFTKKCFFHFDSSSPSSTGFNQDSAKQICRHLASIFSFPDNLFPMPCPQQTNGHDCGMYVLAVTEHLCEYFLANQSIENANIVDNISPSYIRNKRKDLKKLIQKLAAKSQ